MTLHQQLLGVCLTLLAIPWAGCEYIKANERVLQALQQQSLEATGLSIATGLQGRADLLYAYSERASTTLDDNSLRVTVTSGASGAPVLDGYFDEWTDITPRQFGSDRRPLNVSVRGHRQQLYLAVSARDVSKRYNDRGLGLEPVGDRLVLTTWPNGRRQRHVIATAAPGHVRAQPLGRQLAIAQASAISGHWSDVPDGYQIEISLPLSLTGGRLGIDYIDSDEGGISHRGNIDPVSTAAPPWLVLPPGTLIDLLSNYEQAGIRVQIYDRWGWLLGASNPADELEPADSSAFARWLYRQILNVESPTSEHTSTASGRSAQQTILSALKGQSAHTLVQYAGPLRAHFAAPITSDEGLLGVVVVEQPRERYLSLSATAFEGLLLWGGAGLITALLALLGFALITSTRIKRLDHIARDLSQTATAHLPTGPLQDEIDQLAQRFNTLLREQRQLQDYLRALPRTLVHEIRTPVAIIRSTLEHLEQPDIGADDKKALLARGQAGALRLTQLLDSMNEANRLENSVDTDNQQAIDLVELLSQLRDAYAQTFPRWRFELDCECESASASAVPELLVQAMDKLVANATSFTDTGGMITLKLVNRGLWWRLSVANPGPHLPDDTSNLFAPMVSHRRERDGQHSHLGLGLYIVALVARQHGGEPWACNTQTPPGAEVGFTVRA